MVEGDKWNTMPRGNAGASHQIANTGSEVLKFLCCCAPGYEHEDTVLEE